MFFPKSEAFGSYFRVVSSTSIKDLPNKVMVIFVCSENMHEYFFNVENFKVKKHTTFKVVSSHGNRHTTRC